MGIRISWGTQRRKADTAMLVHTKTSVVANPNPKALVAVEETANKGQSPKSCTNAELFFQSP
ncbi:protein of unknown function [Xenorhabdus doucetiae]|uniref:Uncharacterized protein n=1 Tax=Xenorhabdus doucetiae TaxID=351671 RepID=A0A068QS96_9GAMM|nr:protein of unknown function [Xenorhabdus doucetiae]